MKKDTHPDYHKIIVEMTDGTTLKHALLGGMRVILQLDIDPSSHPAWVVAELKF